MVLLALLALAAGLLLGHFGAGFPLWDLLLHSQDGVLNLLMLSVGVSIGLQRGIWQSMRRQPAKVLVIPLGVTAGSLLGGGLCALLTGYPLAESASIAACMGWYSLGGVTIEALAGGVYGGVAFLSNLMREILSFFCIPLLAKYLNPAACIAAAGATSEDTTLPVMMKYTGEENVVLSVFNGVVCSAFVPVLLPLCYHLGLR